MNLLVLKLSLVGFASCNSTDSTVALVAITRRKEFQSAH